MVSVVFSSHLGFLDSENRAFTLLSSVYVSIGLSSRTASREVLSPLQSLTSVFGMGTGGPSAFVTLTFCPSFEGLKNCFLKIEQHNLPLDALVI